MKYLKKFEGLNKKNVDPNEIYSFNVYTKKEPVYLVATDEEKEFYNFHNNLNKFNL